MENKSIYVIISGEYSDWSIIGYAETEQDAMQICAQHNVEVELRGEWEYDWYYEQVDKIQPTKEKIALKYVHEFRFTKHKDGHKVYNYELHYFSEESRQAIPKVLVSEYAAGIEVDVPSKKMDMEHAKKIAQDALYQYLYEKQSKKG